MATPLTADQLIAAFKKWGVKYEETPGWRTHNRNAVGAWGPVNGLLLHHTGDDAPDSADKRVLWNGRTGLPGPLCNWGQTDAGVTVLMGNGRANHAGLGSASTLSHVINEDYKGNLSPGPDSIDGNGRLYGQETMYSGGHNMTDAAYHNTLLTFAAVCDAHGWTAKSAIGHKEWTRRKIDPGHLDMATFRADLQKMLDAGPPGSKTPTKPKPTPAPLPVITSLNLAGKTISKLPVLAHVKLCLDWSWAKPNFHTMSADKRVRGVARYLSSDKTKTITDIERVLLHAEGFWVTFVYEDGSTPYARQRRPLAGMDAGVADAKAADALADAIGVPDDVAIAHPVDSDLSFTAVRDYWVGIHSVARRPRMVYGSANIVDDVVGAGFARYGWQTTSWSQASGKLRISKHANLLQLHSSFRPAEAEVKGLSPNDYDPNLILSGPAIPVWNPGEPKRTPGKPKPKPKPTPKPDPSPVPASKTSLRVGTFNWEHTDRANDQFNSFREQADLWGLCEIESTWERLKLKLLPNGWGVWPVLGSAGAVPIVWRKSRLKPKTQLSFKAGDSEAGVSPQRHVNETAFEDLLTGKTFTHDHGQAPHHIESGGRQMVYKGADVTKFARQPARAKAFFLMMASRAQSVVGPMVLTGDWNVNYHAEQKVAVSQRIPWFPLTAIASLPGMKAEMPAGGTHNDGRAIDWVVVRMMRVLSQHVIKPPAGADPATTSDHYAVITELEI